MKKFFATLIISLFAVSAIFAQQHRGKKDRTPQERIDAQVKKLTKKLDLTEDQVAKTRPLVEKRVNTIESLKGKGKEARPQRKAALEEFDKDFTAILTPEQVKKYEAWKADKKAKAKSRKGKKGSHQNDDDEDSDF